MLIIYQIFFGNKGSFAENWGIFGHVTRLDQSRASENI